MECWVYYREEERCYVEQRKNEFVLQREEERF
jgi:hypothetical protein